MESSSKQEPKMTDREAFEKWASDSGLFPQAIERNGADQYILMTTSHGWLAWQAACKYKDEIKK